MKKLNELAGNGFEELTNENLEKIEQEVHEDNIYAGEGNIIKEVLTAFPDNKDLNIVAMKIAVIDLTNSTHLNQHKNILSLNDLANAILDIDNFDERVENGDVSLVKEITKRSPINIFSFASKYCCYHAVEVYGHDDYSIFDNVVRICLPFYVRGLTPGKIESWRKDMDYESFHACIGKLLDEHHINVSFKRRKFDHFLWYKNRLRIKASVIEKRKSSKKKKEDQTLLDFDPPLN